MNHWKLDKNKSRFCVQVLAWTNRHSRITKSTSTRLNGIGRRPICGTGQLKRDGTRAETRFRLSVKRTSPFKSAGGVSSVDYWQPEVCASAVVMLDTTCSEVVWRVLATHRIRQFSPLQFPVPCVTACRHISTGVYYWYYRPVEMCWHTRINQILSFGETGESF
jgi:hypothetical protein